MTPGPPVPEIDLGLLAGFRYACRPDCGLCCYAEPLATARERSSLLQIVPGIEFGSRGRDRFVRARPDGGACSLLLDHRCRAHPARPAVCREFPLAVHLGTRLQATAVLTCPGVDLAPLLGYSPAIPRAPPEGFESELGSVRSRTDASVLHRLKSATRRRRKVAHALEDEGRWEDEETVRRALRGHPMLPGRADFPAEDPPSAEDGLEYLPLVFDHRSAPVAFGAVPGGWELLELRASGGVERSLGVVPPPTTPPTLSPDAERTVGGYLEYWLARDALFGTIHLAMLEEETGRVSEWIAAELRAIGALTISRAYVWAGAHRGEVGPLSGSDLLAGVRAVDQDLLDRPGWGERL